MLLAAAQPPNTNDIVGVGVIIGILMTCALYLVVKMFVGTRRFKEPNLRCSSKLVAFKDQELWCEEDENHEGPHGAHHGNTYVWWEKIQP